MTLGLEYHRQIFAELLSADGLLILARGLGLRRILCNFLKLHADPKNLVLLINTETDEEQQIREELNCLGCNKPGLKVINNETSVSERTEVYLSGGILSVTSRILVVDLLTKRIPTHLITGILVNHAHKITELSLEAFILRLFREENKEGFIKAFSDSPESFTTGFAPLEKTLKLLFLRKVYLWPRFHVAIKESLEDSKAEVIELQQSLTKNMEDIQNAIIDCIQACLSELKRSNPTIDVDSFTVENALFKSFDVIVRKQLDPIWHRVSYKTKQLVGDLKTLRRLISYLVNYDCVTFNSFLETILASNSPTANIGKNITQSPWLFTDASDTLFTTAKSRVYKIQEGRNERANRALPPNMVPVLEELPKWQLLRSILTEIGSETIKANLQCTILILVENERTCAQLKSYLDSLTDEPSDEPSPMLLKLLKNYFHWKRGIARVSGGVPEKQYQSKAPVPQNDASQRSAPSNKRRRVRGGAKPNPVPRSVVEKVERELSELSASVNNDQIDHISNALTLMEEDEEFDIESFSTYFGLVSKPHIMIRPYKGEADARMLEDLQPEYIIMYDPNPTFIRQTEVFKALHPDSMLRVYFFIYDNSVEEQRYLSLIRKEKDAFERLIHEKSIMALPSESTMTQPQNDTLLETLNSRIAGGAVQSAASQVIVDLREFRSSLPSILHAHKLKIIPCTLEVGDYILSPTMCVERKSISDLIGSLNSGRLYTQAEAMSVHYKVPILLIEFDESKSFSLQSLGEMKSDIGLNDLSSKLVLLTIHFPKLRLIWSSSPHATAKIFEDLKKNHDEPDIHKAMTVGVESVSEINSSYSITPQDVLRSLPGITSKNYRFVMSQVENIQELSEMSLERLQKLIGDAPGKELHDFFRKTL
ncbi:DNA repair endonuclease XPF [Basidiobolus meristosporus CBS 931.73]|uniref:DNA repair endonuclease XPF n=1 Tax=Basidiobolus meristosporus CBS 931.73 TaxID=1314790 RepID=A0A1Y1Y7G6_9FUNG|nr:DNA repair endonuclease XPF [Basidiobolus meristosporus CBS 931.73]|eukprot:ORX93909.1 DNA repair endonuclease XPF [Basidiobolus meristosporus CBS 931.73]